MTIIFNDRNILINSDRKSVLELLTEEKTPLTGSAVALNGRLLTKDKWKVTMLQDGDSLTVISAAFGG